MRTSNFQMKNPVLLSVVLKVNDEFQPSEDPLKLDISDAKDILYNDENAATVSYSVRVFDEEFKSGAPFFIEVLYAADFRWTDLGDKEVEDLLKYNAPAILLGYVRPLIALLSSNAGFPPLHIPLLNLQNEDEIEDEVND